MTQFSHHKTVLLAMEEAVRRGRPDIAADILSAHPTVRAYVRAPSSPLGMQRKPWNGPFPKGTKYIVIVNFEPLEDGKSFYVIPVTTFMRVLKRNHVPRVRPVNPESHHTYIVPEKLFPEYLNAWHLVPQTGGNHTVHIGDVLVDHDEIRAALGWLNDNMDSGHATFTSAMQALGNPLAKWSAGTVYKGLGERPDKVSIRAYLWEMLAESEVIEAAESAGAVSGGQGFAINQADKVAVENRAMAAAREYYAGEGWQEADKDAYKHNPFDLILTRDGEVMHAEVKGMQQSFKGTVDPRIAVNLSANEVAHARQCEANPPCQSMELFILTDVEITRDGTESIGSGGEAYIRNFSNLDDEHLKPITYRFTTMSTGPLTSLGGFDEWMHSPHPPVPPMTAEEEKEREEAEAFNPVLSYSSRR